MATRTTWREDLTAALTGGLLILGLFVDGWNHLNLQNGEAGSFLTPWHGLLYAGFNACAIWTITRNPRLRAMLLPAGLPQLPALGAPHLALAGLGLAGAGMAAEANVLLFGGLAVVLGVALHVAGGVPALCQRVAAPALLASATAAAVVVALGGLPGHRGVDGAAARVAPTPSATATPTATPTVTRTVLRIDHPRAGHAIHRAR